MMSVSNLGTGFLTAIVALAITAPVAATTSADQSSLILDKARARQSRVGGFEVRFNRIEVQAPGGISAIFTGLVPPGKTIPPVETTLRSENRLVVQDVRVRYEQNDPTWSASDGTLIRRRQIHVCNGKVAKTLLPDGDQGKGGASVGVIQERTWHTSAKSYVLLPFMMTFRSLEPTLAAYDLRRLTPADVNLPIKGVACQRWDTKLGGITISFWLDAEGLIRRLQKQRDGKLTEQADIQYEERESESVPISWVWTCFGRSGKVLIATTIEVTHFQFRKRVDSSEFEVTFPQDCVVHDLKERKDFLVQADGRMREIDSNTGKLLGTKYQDDSGLSITWVFLVGVGVIVFLLLIVYGVRRLRKTR